MHVGTMMLNFRPVDCATGEPLTFLPGFINQSIYTEAVESGWSYNVYGADDNQFALPVCAHLHIQSTA